MEGFLRGACFFLLGMLICLLSIDYCVPYNTYGFLLKNTVSFYGPNHELYMYITLALLFF